MAKRSEQKPGMSRLILRVGVVLVGGYLVIGMIFNQMEISAKRQQLDTVQQQLAAQQAKNDEVTRILESGSDEEIIERVARDKLGYAKPNERVFVDVTGK